MNMFIKLIKGLYALYSQALWVGLPLFLISVVAYGVIVLANPVVADRSDLIWDQGYLEGIQWSERKGKNYIIIYSDLYKKRRYFSPTALLNERSLKKRIDEDSYYDREIKIGWKGASELNDFFPDYFLNSASIYEIVYKGDVLVKFEKTLEFVSERSDKFDFYFSLVLFVINFPFIFYLLLCVGVKCYGWLR